ncbi:MAG: PAS domain S-box protein [Rubrivivax sp.]|nr:PAS domain S-box protein [Rubrivivax sp.]
MTPPSPIDFGFSLLVNAALLLSLMLLTDITFGRRLVRALERPNWVAGLAVGAVGVLLMKISSTLMTGIIFDTRSVLLAISGLVLGPLPTAIAMAMTASYRVWLGGAVGVGVAVVVASGALGLLWRQRLHRPLVSLGALDIYTLGLAVHVVMLGLMLFLPNKMGLPVLSHITLPVMLIYPAFTAALGMLLVERLRRARDLASLQEREARYHSLFDDNLAAMLLMDADSGAIVDANPAAVRFYGWPHEKLVTMKIHDINTLPAAAVLAEMAAARARQRQHFEFRHRLADGSVRDIEAFASPIRLGGHDYLYAIVHDVSQRKAAEAELDTTRKRLEMALRAAHQGIYDVDLQTGVTVVSEDYARMHGNEPASLQETLGTWMGRLHPDDRARVMAVFNDHIAGRLPEYRVEFRQRKADGSWLWVMSVGQVVDRDAEGRALRLLGTHTDITERKRAEEELRRRNEELQRFNQAMVGREFSMIQLKQEVNALRGELGREPAYPLHFLNASDGDATHEAGPAPIDANAAAPARHGA